MPDWVEDSKQALGETFKPDNLECDSCGHHNGAQFLYCQNCAKILAAPDTTSEQREQLTRQIMESTLKDYGIYWRPLLDRGIPSDEAAVLKEARNKVKRAKEWGQKNGHPEIVTVEQRWDHDTWFKSEQIKLGLTRSDMIEWTERSHNRLPQQPLPSYLVKQQVEGRYKLSSRRGDSKPLREIPGIREELKRNPCRS